jgi:hypothetical protein
MTTALEGGEGSASLPGCSLPAGKTRYPLYRRLGETHRWSGQVQKILPPPGFDPQTVQPVASRYTHYATRPNLTAVEFVYLRMQRASSFESNQRHAVLEQAQPCCDLLH